MVEIRSHFVSNANHHYNFSWTVLFLHFHFTFFTHHTISLERASKIIFPHSKKKTPPSVHIFLVHLFFCFARYFQNLSKFRFFFHVFSSIFKCIISAVQFLSFIYMFFFLFWWCCAWYRCIDSCRNIQTNATALHIE